MNLGEKLLNLRKSKNLSQEEAADKLNVTRQTISKWETNQSTPDFDKIIPICNLYGITTEELLTDKEHEEINIIKEDNIKEKNNEIKIKRAKGISISILLYFLAVILIIICIPYLRINPILATAIFLLTCGVATFIIVYTCLVYKEEKSEKEKQENKLKKQIEDIIALITIIIYLIISFTTNAWHITWIIWIIFGLISEILNLIFIVRSNKNE